MPHLGETIVILDYGSQYTQLIARRVRELSVYCEIRSWSAPPQEVIGLQPVGFILSGGPNSVYDPDAPSLPPYVLQAGVPILGLCYGLQLLAHTLGGKVAPAGRREYGPAQVTVTDPQSPLFAGLDTTLDVTQDPLLFLIITQGAHLNRLIKPVTNDYLRYRLSDLSHKAGVEFIIADNKKISPR